MKGAAIAFAPQINAFAAASGRELDREEVESLEKTLNSISNLDDAGQITFELGHGRVGMLDDALAIFSTGMGKAIPIATTEPSIPAGSNATARSLAANAAVREGRSAARLVEAESLVAEHGSPWDPRSISRTRQALVSNLSPDLAARLRRQAGIQK